MLAIAHTYHTRNNALKLFMQAFNNHAATYNQYATIQQVAVQYLVQHLPQHPPHTILELGAGTGLLTQQLRQQYPNSHITAIDSSANMLAQCHTADEKHVMRIEDCTLKADLVVSSMALQWVCNSVDIIKKYKSFAAIFTLRESFPEWGHVDARAHLPALQDFKDLPFPQQVITHKVTYKNKADFVKTLRRTGAHTPAENYKPIKLAEMREIMRDQTPFTATWSLLCIKKSG